MNKKIILPLLALSIYIVITWPKEVKFPVYDDESSSQVNKEKEHTPRAPQRTGDPNFKPEVVKQPDSEKKEEYFRVTAPEAIAYAENDRLAHEQGPGETPYLTKKEISESKQLQSVIEAVNNPKEFGSRLSPIVRATPFDRQRFQSDETYREEYLSTAEPGRVYQVNSQSDFKIERVSPYYQEVEQGDSVTISVKAEPNMPVSITSFDLGKFANHLTFQTVLADSSGLATFEFYGMPGTFNDTNILASSPTSKGNVKFVVNTKIKPIKEN